MRAELIPALKEISPNSTENGLTMNLELEQQAMQVRSADARSRQARKNAGSGKKKRTRISIKDLIVKLAQDSRVTGQVRLEALRLLLAMGGKLPEEKHEEPKPEPIVPRGSDLGSPFPRN